MKHSHRNIRSCLMITVNTISIWLPDCLTACLPTYLPYPTLPYPTLPYPSLPYLSITTYKVLKSRRTTMSVIYKILVKYLYKYKLLLKRYFSLTWRKPFKLWQNYSLMVSYFPEKLFPVIHGDVVTIISVQYFQCFICFV